MNQRKLFKTSSMQRTLLVISIIIICIIFAFLSKDFLKWSSLSTILVTMAMTCVIGIGVTFVLTAGEIDVSMGAMLSVPTVIITVLMTNGVALPICIIIAFLTVLGLGFLNGILTVKFRIPSFVATLGVQGVAMGLSRIISNNTSVQMTDENFLSFFGRNVGGSEFPTIIIWLIIATVVGYFLLHKTRFGRNIQCTGDNKDAAFSFGVNIDRTVIMSFVVCAIFTFLAAMLMLARSNFATPGEGESYTLNAIVAAVIGGTSINGGKGSILGTFLGSIFIGIISYGLFLLSFNSWTESIVSGIIIIIVLTVSSMTELRERELQQT